ncbi:unnamed protein product [Symbiodinium sp. CCMP2592]|nr:unnamed protein product [Symbiodinium sp. CCMP2592]
MRILHQHGVHQFALHGTYGQILKQTCAWCGQWIASPYMVKNHFHNSHPELMQQYSSQLNKFLSDIVPRFPCAYCTSTVKEKARHIPRMTLPADQVQQLFGGILSEDHNPRPNKAPKSQLRQDKGTGKGGRGWSKRSREAPPMTHAQQTSGDTEHLISLLSRLVLRHEDSVAVLRQNTGWVMYLQTQKHACSVVDILVKLSVKWHSAAQKEAPVGRVPLRCILLQGLVQELLNRLSRQEVVDAAKQAGWVTDDGWIYQVWCPNSRCLKANGSKSPMSHATMLEKLQTLQRALANDSAIHRFRSLRPLREQMEGETVVMLLDLAILEEDGKLAQALMQELTGNSVCQVVGLQFRRESLQRSSLARELQQTLNDSYMS